MVGSVKPIELGGSIQPIKLVELMMSTEPGELSELDVFSGSTKSRMPCRSMKLVSNG